MGLIAHILKYYGYEKVDRAPTIKAADPEPEPEILTMMPREQVNDYFVQHKIRFSEILKPGQKVTLRWDYIEGKMDDTMIEDIIPSCGCTADIRIGKKGISAVFTHTKKKLPPEGKEETFGLTVYFRDGFGKVKNDKGATIWDPNKKRRTLTFGGMLLP